MRRIALLAVALATAACTDAARAGAADPWPFEITAQCRPGAYWWCPGSAFDRESIDWNLEKMRDGGIGTAHIVPIYGAKGYEKRYIRFLSPEWMKMLDHIVAKAGELGIQVDMTTGTGWCFGGPGLPSFARDMRVRWDSRKKRVSHRGGRNVKRPAPGGEGAMLNAYSTRAMRHYLERFSKAFDSSRCRLPRAQYHDSFEYA
ncbi:MAG: glycosyl hydrolase, partial [Planctomycetota bacterium]